MKKKIEINKQYASDIMHINYDFDRLLSLLDGCLSASPVLVSALRVCWLRNHNPFIDRKMIDANSRDRLHKPRSQTRGPGREWLSYHNFIFICHAYHLTHQNTLIYIFLLNLTGERSKMFNNTDINLMLFIYYLN